MDLLMNICDKQTLVPLISNKEEKQMKKVFKIYGFIALVILTLAVAVSVSASETITVNTNTMNIVVDGERVSGDNFVYLDTTYVPLRKVAEMLGKKVDWDPSVNGALISDTSEPAVTETEDSIESLIPVKGKNIDVDRNTMNIYVNGELVNADNFVYKNTTYVPLRKVSEMLNKEVSWEKISNTASIGEKGISFYDGEVLGNINGHEYTDYMYEYYAKMYADERDYLEMIGEDVTETIGASKEDYIYDKLKFDYALIDYALSNGMTMRPHYHSSYYESVKSTLKGVKGDMEKFDAMLKMQGFTSLNSYYYAMIVSDLYVQYAENFENEVTVDEIEDYYNKNEEMKYTYSIDQVIPDITVILAREKATKAIEKMAETVVITK